ncbi:OmpA family protein [Agrilutibacter solisilvae]|uniref:OmpA family protein n=1 Tax=Agrilutibacter solisilvae TaxID=2763317 RepID=A0A974XW08_9GAMM|nr:OmpA family protein [Lysobacter solisilvae]QSX76926.1 OmpA family protein [Lysobacter solisilvae]
MNKKLLCAALLGGLSMVQVAQAQDFDDRWYLTGAAGFNIQDNDRRTENAPFLAVGIGKQLTRNWALDLEVNYQNPQFEANDDLLWSQYGASIDARHFWVEDGRAWNPYVLLGMGIQHSEMEFDNFPNPNSPGQREDDNIAAKLGVGIQSDVGPVAIRTELAYRHEFDDVDVDEYSAFDDSESDRGFGDLLLSIGVVIPLGAEKVAAPPPPPAESCADKDSDGDGVNDCDDKCPNSQAGQTIGPDGCPVPISIDLKGVNFDFDKSTLRPDAVAILNEAIEILKRYPELKVEVAGHTDECGSDDYNQGLSDRRSRAVYDFLTSNGIDAARLSGPNGYGESRPLEQLGDDFPGCKSEKNRRTELNVQN